MVIVEIFSNLGFPKLYCYFKKVKILKSIKLSLCKTMKDFCKDLFIFKMLPLNKLTKLKCENKHKSRPTELVQPVLTFDIYGQGLIILK